MPPAVSTAEAKGAATEIATRELTEALTVLSPIADREKQNEKWRELQEGFHPETKTFINLTTTRELQHYDFMERTLPKVTEIRYDKTKRKPHDWSKEGVFFFALPAFYDGGVKGADIKQFVDKELKRHYIEEPHHPEHEMHTGNECTKEDIVEMAIDRLARNAQFGDGWIRFDSVMKFLPKFTIGDNEAKQAIFKEYAAKYQQLVQDEFYDMFPETKAWKKE